MLRIQSRINGITDQSCSENHIERLFSPLHSPTGTAYFRRRMKIARIPEPGKRIYYLDGTDTFRINVEIFPIEIPLIFITVHVSLVLFVLFDNKLFYFFFFASSKYKTRIFRACRDVDRWPLKHVFYYPNPKRSPCTRNM